jgi:AcrR family transcriptional regulator
MTMRTQTNNQTTTGGNTRAANSAGEMSCATRQSILEAARSRFLHYGFKKTTIDEIAVDAGVGKGTVYLYFDSKEDLLTTIALDVKKNITEQMRAIAGSFDSPEEKLKKMVLAAITSVHNAVYSTAHGLELVGDMIQPKLKHCGMKEREAQLDLIAKVVSEGVRNGDFDLPSIDARCAAEHLMLTMVSFFPPYFSPCHEDQTCRRQLETRVTEHFDFVLHGIKRR